MITARLSYIAVFLAGLAFFLQLDRAPALLELVVFFVAGALCYEFAARRLAQKIQRWPSDLETGRRIVDTFSNDFLHEIRSAQFGWITEDGVARLRLVASPELGQERFNDSDLNNSFRYLRATIREFLSVVDSEMFGDGPGRLVIPIEWKSAPVESGLYQRYRQAQARLGASGLKIEEAVRLFVDCFQGASFRL